MKAKWTLRICLKDFRDSTRKLPLHNNLSLSDGRISYLLSFFTPFTIAESRSILSYSSSFDDLGIISFIINSNHA